LKIRGVRWLMIGLVFLATVINYIDRQTLAILKKTICDDLGLSDTQYGLIFASFLVAYAISQTLSGKLYDAIGTRRGFTASIVVWSVAAMAHAAARGVASFSACRIVLGLGEAGNWPGAAKAAGEWFPVRERALAMGIFNTGAALGGAASPPVIAWLALSYGWRPTFIITGLLGFLWLGLWLVSYRLPEEHPWLTRDEHDLIVQGQRDPAGAPASDTAERELSLKELLRYRQTWAVIVARLVTDPIWWLYIGWLPAYFQEARGLNLKSVGATAWLPYLAGGVGALAGGWLSGFLIRRGVTVDRARKTAMLLGAGLTPAGVLAMGAATPTAALLWMAVVLFGFQVWVNNVQTLPSDFFPRSAIASVTGMSGTAAGLTSAAYVFGTGYVVDYFKAHGLANPYTPIFVLAGLLGPVGLIATFLLAGRIHRLPPRPRPATGPGWEGQWRSA
jgi:ACS family hexuronate transporter-like MFS transporter